MKNTLKKQKDNWKTTVLGFSFAILTAWTGIDLTQPFSPQSVFSLAVATLLAVVGYLMEDSALKGTK